jgi:hypothetical protein
MGSPLTTTRKHMTKIAIFHLMTWLTKHNDNGFIAMNRTDIKLAVEKDHPDLHITLCGVMKAMEDLGIKCPTTKIKENIAEHELLVRIKRIEKFIALNFPEEWANL